MLFCSKCGEKIAKEVKFCPKCGEKQGSQKEPKEKIEPKKEEVKPKTEPVSVANQTNSSTSNGSKTNWGLTCGLLGCGGIVLIIIIILIIFGLGTLGAKGQPGTIIKPTSVKTPKNLAIAGQDKNVNLTWKQGDAGNITKYNVYKSTTANSNFQKLYTLENTINLAYSDTAVEKGITYHYVVTAVGADGMESGNSNQVSYALESAPLLPNGVQTWQDVLTKYDGDEKYKTLFEQVTGYRRANIEKFIALQAKGKALQKKLVKGSVITNTTENYKILYNYTLPSDKTFLTDDKGNIVVMIYCGNPVKLIKEMTEGAKFISYVQEITYNIIYILPASTTTTILYAADPLNGFIDPIIPDGSWGPNYDPGHPQDNPNAGQTTTAIASPSSSGTPTTTLTSGQQWAVEGKVLVEATPHDPTPGENVVITVSLNPAEAGINIEYTVSGTDGYSDSGTKATDVNGKIQFDIPGGAGGIVDTINVKVPSKNLEGSTNYTF